MASFAQVELLRRPAARLVSVVLGLSILLSTQRALVQPTNFGGFDEWPMLNLSSRSITDVAYANRPLGLLWLLPARIWPHTFRAFASLSFVYLLLTALLLLRLCRRLAPRRPLHAFLAAALFLVWAPGDLARLSTVECALYAGITFGMMAVLVVLVESWLDDRGLTLFLACVLLGVVTRSYEGSFAVLAAAPVLLAAAGDRSRRLVYWCGAWLVATAFWAAVAVVPLLRTGDVLGYQRSMLRPSLDPWILCGRLARQYAYHLGPLVLSPPRELATIAVPIAVAVFAVVFLIASSDTGDLDDDGWAPHVLRAALGMLFAGLGYALIVVGTAAPTAFRLQFLSGPGIAAALAAVIMWLAGRFPRHLRRAAALCLACWVVAVGTGRTVAMQQVWDRGSRYAAQMSMLRGLVASAPDFEPGTMILTIDDDGGTWHGTSGFHHAVQYLYEGHAAGCVWGAWNALYPSTFGSDGLRVEPWPVIRGPWMERPRTYAYPQIVVARFGAGSLEILDDWPLPLPPLPKGAVYEPRKRIVAAPGLPESRVLR